MPDHNDPVDAWLKADVELLHPPTQAFQRISRRAGRRRATQLVSAVAGAVVVITAAVTVPQIAGLLPGGSPAANLGGGSPASSHGASAASKTPASQAPSNPASPNGSPSISPPLLPPGTALSATSSGHRVPARFRPTSVTFISAGIGAVIGQAGPPCYTRYCTSLAGTSSYGGTWYGVSAPLTGAAGAANGVSQLRFLNLSDGWAYGPGLWYTTAGGRSWQQSSLQADHPGTRITHLETSNGVALAVAGSCSGTGPGFAADCTSFTLYRTAAGSDAWQPVAGAEGLAASGGGPTSASLVLTANGTTAPAGATGYLLTPAGTILSGSLSQPAWRKISTPPCAPGTAQPDAQPSGALLTSVPGQLIIACPGGGSAPTRIYSWSTRAGSGSASWNLAGTLTTGSRPTSLAAQPGGVELLATGGGIEYSADGGVSWRLAEASPPGAAAARSGFSYVGMTTPRNGVAVPADAALGEVFVTTDGGKTWHPSRIL